MAETYAAISTFKRSLPNREGAQNYIVLCEKELSKSSLFFVIEVVLNNSYTVEVFLFFLNWISKAFPKGMKEEKKELQKKN